MNLIAFLIVKNYVTGKPKERVGYRLKFNFIILKWIYY